MWSTDADNRANCSDPLDPFSVPASSDPSSDLDDLAAQQVHHHHYHYLGSRWLLLGVVVGVAITSLILMSRYLDSEPPSSNEQVVLMLVN